MYFIQATRILSFMLSHYSQSFLGFCLFSEIFPSRKKIPSVVLLDIHSQHYSLLFPSFIIRADSSYSTDKLKNHWSFFVTEEKSHKFDRYLSFSCTPVTLSICFPFSIIETEFWIKWCLFNMANVVNNE